MIAAFVQARMSSRRFPGKILAPFRGEPLIQHVLDRVKGALPDCPVIVLTSEQTSDDPLVYYLERQGVTTFRGPLDDVFDRFRQCAAVHPADWILRVCADSPLLSSDVLRFVAAEKDEEVDVVSTVFRRSTPKGMNAELIRAEVFHRIDASELTAEDREHVTSYLYKNSDRFRIRSVVSCDPSLAELNLCVDTVADLERLDALSEEEYGRILERLSSLVIA